MFSKTKNIESAFRHIRLFSIIVVALSFVLCGVVIYKSYEVNNDANSKVYVMANGKILEAFSSERKENIPAEAKDHVAVFHQYFFTLDPDEKVINKNLTKALYLADASAKRQYENLKENNFYTNIISGNISQQITVDSISLNTDRYPYYFKCFSTQQIIRATSIVYRNLVTEGYLRNVSRSDNNPHGLLIERWSTIENNDIKTITR